MISQVLEHLSGTKNPANWFVDWIRGGDPTVSGVNVTCSVAETYSAVWAATRLLSESVASLPSMLYRRRLSGDGRDRLRDDPLAWLVHDEPNPEMDSFTFWCQQFPMLVNRGLCYAEKELSIGGQLLALWPLHTANVSPKRLDSGKIVFDVREDNGETRHVPAERMLYIVGPLTEDGIIGKGVIQKARESIGLGLATEKHGAAFFGNGAVPGGVLQRPVDAPELSSGAAERLKDSFNREHQGAENSSKIALLEEGTTYLKTSIDNNDAQFLETRQHNITEIARWYGLPPHMLADLSKATFSNITEENLAFVIRSLRPWIVRIEKALTRQLLPFERKRQEYFEFNLDALLRGDPTTRAESLSIQRRNGIINGDEWRAKENLNPLPDGQGKAYLVSSDMTTMDLTINPPEPPAPVLPPGAGEGKPGDDKKPPADEKKPPAKEKQSADVAEALEKIRQDYQEREATDRERRVRAARAVLDETIGRMLAKEANAANRAAKDPSKFLAWLDGFYEKHEGTLSDALASPFRAWMAAKGCDADIIPPIIRCLIDYSRNSLLVAAECQPNELPERVAECVAGWSVESHWKGKDHV